MCGWHYFVFCVLSEPWRDRDQPVLAWTLLYPQYLPVQGPAQSRGSGNVWWLCVKEEILQTSLSLTPLAALSYPRTLSHTVRGWWLPNRVGERAELTQAEKVQEARWLISEVNPARKAESARTTVLPGMERFNPGNGHLGAEADHLTSSGAPEPILFLPLSFGLSLTPKTPA